MRSRLVQDQGWGSSSSQWRHSHCRRQRRSQHIQKTNHLRRKFISFFSCWKYASYQNRDQQSSWSEYLSRFCSGQIQLRERQSLPVRYSCDDYKRKCFYVATCMRMMIDPLTMRKNWSILAFIASRSALAWVDFKVSAITRKWRPFKVPVQAQTDPTVEWEEQKMQWWTMRLQLLHPGANPAQGGSWWVGGVPGWPVQRGLPSCWGTLAQEGWSN